MKFVKKAATILGITAFWLALWFIGSRAVNNSLILPTPFETAKRLCELILEKDFWIFSALSLIRIIIGIAIAIPSALIMSAICSYSVIAKKLFEPAVLIMKSTPVVSFILIAIFIFDREIIPYRNICEGISQAPNELLEMAQVFRVPWMLKIRKIYFHSVAPYFCSALTTSIGLAIKAGIAAEVVAYIPLSIGKKLSDAKSYMEPADLLAWTAVIIILSLLLEQAARLLLSSITRRTRNDSN